MSTNSLRVAASAALICVLFSNASAFAMAAGGAAGAPGAGAAGGGAGSGNGGPPSTAAVVLPNDTDRTPYWRFHKVQKARDACPAQFPRCRQDELD